MSKQEKDFNFFEFEQRIKKYMSKAGIKTKKELSEKIGVSAQTVSYWCNGTHTPSPYNIMCVADVLGVNPQWLTGESDFPAILTGNKVIDDLETGKHTDTTFKLGKPITFNELIKEGIKSNHDELKPEYEKVLEIMDILGYYQAGLGGDNDYLIIPESKKAAITNYKQLSANFNGEGLPYSFIECKYLLTQLESIVDLFENTIINYFSSEMAAFNRKQKEQLEAYDNKESYWEGLWKIAPEEMEKYQKEHIEKYFSEEKIESQKPETEPEPENKKTE